MSDAKTLRAIIQESIARYKATGHPASVIISRELAAIVFLLRSSRRW
jgi:hypothetical protein